MINEGLRGGSEKRRDVINRWGCITEVPGVRVGDEVVALGSQGGDEIRVRELATQAQTIPWEILTNIGARVPRVYKNFKTARGK